MATIEDELMRWWFWAWLEGHRARFDRDVVKGIDGSLLGD
jgi:hypothetical protein